MEVPLGPEVSPGTVSGGSLIPFPVEGPAFLQLILHEEILISSTNKFYFTHC